MAESTYPYVHEPLVQDMVSDMAAQMHGMSRRLDHKLRKHGELLVYDVTFLASAFNRRSFERDLMTPQLDPDQQHHQIETGVATVASEVGEVALVRMVQVLDMPPFFYHKRCFRHPETQERITPSDWTHEVWAPDYGQRFADAAMLTIQLGAEATQ